MKERWQDLYDVARKVCHACGLPWTDPRTGEIHHPPRGSKRGGKSLKKKKRKRR